MMIVPVASGARIAGSEPVGLAADSPVDPGRFERALAAVSPAAVERTFEARLATPLSRPAPGRGTPGERVLAAMDGSDVDTRGSARAAPRGAPTAADTPGARVLDTVDRSRRRPGAAGEESDLVSAAASAEAGRAGEAAKAASSAASVALAAAGAASDAAASRVGRQAGHRSGLAWQSGFYNASSRDYLRTLMTDERGYLGRGTDIFTSFWTHDTLEGARRAMGGMFGERFRALAERDIRLVQAVPLATREHSGRIEDILHGTLRDDYVQLWRDLGTTMAQAGSERPVVRLGWEMNLSSGGYAWNQSNGSISPRQFVELYRLAADSIRSTMPGAVLCWNPGRSSSGGHHIDEYYPGNDYVDIIGVDFYDNGSGGIPYLDNDRLWEQNFMRTNDTGPVGIGAWYEYARSRGRQFAVPEWGLTDGKDGRWHTDLDRPEFIENMHRFFEMAAREGNLAFESYFNGQDRHRLYPVLDYRQAASATYRDLFQGGGTSGSGGGGVPPPGTGGGGGVIRPGPSTGSGGGGGGGTPGTEGPPRHGGGVPNPRPPRTGELFDEWYFRDDSQLALAMIAQAMPQQLTMGTLAVEDEPPAKRA